MVSLPVGSLKNWLYAAWTVTLETVGMMPKLPTEMELELARVKKDWLK